MQQVEERTLPELAELRVVASKHPWQWLATAVITVLAALLCATIAANENMRWDVVTDYLFNEQVIDGVIWTVVLTAVCMAVSIVLGVLIAVMRTSGNRLLRTVAFLYLWFFRGTPLLVQLIFWFNLALVFPELGLPMFFGDGAPGGIDTNRAVGWFVAALLGFGLHEAAYMSEIVRSGFLSIPKGQTEAAEALGMTRGQLLRRVLLPQAMRVIVPPTVNQFVNLLKATSLVAFIAGEDLLSAVQTIYAENFLVIPLLIVASSWYLVLVTVASIGQHYVEKRLGRGYGSATSASRRPVQTEPRVQPEAM